MLRTSKFLWFNPPSAKDSQHFRYEYGLLKIADLEQTRPNVLAVLNKYRAAKGDVIHVVHQGPPQAPIMTGGTDLEKEFPELEPIAGEHVSKLPSPPSRQGDL